MGAFLGAGEPGTPDYSTVYVDGNLSANTYTYSIANRNTSGTDGMGFTTLNFALAAVDNGGTIKVRAGTYAELGQADVCYPIIKNMTIQAYNGETVNLTYPAGNPPLASAGEYGQIIRHNNNVTLDGLTIIGTHDEGDSVSQDLDISVSIGTSGRGAIQNCTFQKWGHAAIKLGNVAGNVLIDNNDFQAGGFTGRDHHIYATGDYRTNTLTIRNSDFAGATGWGVHLYGYAYGATVTGNNIHDNQGGVLVAGESHVITGNTITDNIGGKGINFFHYGLINLTVTGNTCSGNTSHDLFLDAGEGEGFTGCTFADNTGTQNW